jgi:conjugal transfer pilus assembly protein TraV
MNSSKLAVLALTVALLSGCGPVLNPYKENFKCKTPGEDGKCVDTPTAYKDARYPEDKLAEKANKKPCVDCDKPTGSSNTEEEQDPGEDIHAARYKVLSDLLKEPKKPLLQPPKILRVLMLPYEGESKELFMTRYVYVQVENARWVLTDQHEAGR